MRKAKWTTVFALAFVLIAGSFASAQQLPLAPTAIPQFVQPLPRLITDVPVLGLGGETTFDISLCEFQTSILPAGTPIGGAPAVTPPLTWVWGYEQGGAAGFICPTSVTHPYIGPVVLAKRGNPTTMTYYNNLPDATQSHVLAYKQSTDQTLQWADPFSLSAFGPYPPPDFIAGMASCFDSQGNPKACPIELNDCNFAASQIPLTATLLLGPYLPTPCYDNYGFYWDPAVAPFAVPPVGQTRMTYAAPVPAAVHLHGGEIPAMLDGGPDAWWTKDGIKGHGYYTSQVPGVITPANAAIYTYPNVQEPAPTWFHDHVLGATRLNVYAGIAGAYYQYDDTFGLAPGLVPLGLPNGAGGGLEPLIPVVIQDRSFDTNGQLLFPAAGLNPQHPFWVPEFVGDVMVVNGKAWPFLEVEPKRYRFLFLNGSNARSYELFLVNSVTKQMGPPLWVIGNDQGYLDVPAKIDPNLAANNKLVMMPGERYEVIIDFTGQNVGYTIQLRNTAKTPYPGGVNTVGNTTGRIMQFNVVACASGSCGAANDGSYDPKTLAAIRTTDPIQRLANTNGTPAATIHTRRVLTLNEVIGAGGPVEILMNNTKYLGFEGDPKDPAAQIIRPDFTPITTEWNTTYYSELPEEGTTEEWDIVNLTADAHPIHPHLVAFQILNRQKLSMTAYNTAYATAFGGIVKDAAGPPCDYNTTTTDQKCAPPPKTKIPKTPYIGGNPDPNFYVSGAAFPPVPAEVGWKDTAMSLPGQVLRMIVRFAPTHLPNTTLPADAFYSFDPNHGHGYVWHCHIIDHEDNEMMRPFSVTSNTAPGVQRTFVMGTDY